MLKILDKRQVSEIVHLSSKTIWRLEQAGSFPARIQFAPGRVGWKSTDIEAWISSRPSVDTMRTKKARHLAELLLETGKDSAKIKNR